MEGDKRVEAQREAHEEYLVKVAKHVGKNAKEQRALPPQQDNRMHEDASTQCRGEKGQSRAETRVMRESSTDAVKPTGNKGSGVQGILVHSYPVCEEERGG